MARKSMDPRALAAKLGMSSEEVKVAPSPAPRAEEANISQEVAENPSLDKPQENEVAIYMDLDKLSLHPKNSFSMDEDKLIELAHNIEDVGLLEYPLAWVNAQGNCEILSGHRRVCAYKWLRDNVDDEKYASIPVRFRDDIDTEGKALRILHSANFYNREQLPSEKARSAAMIYEDIQIMREEDESLVGVLSREIAADILHTNYRSVERLVRIHKNLIDELKGLWDKGVLTQMQAEELTTLTHAHQEEFFELAKDCTEKLTKQQLIAFRKQVVGVEPKATPGRPKNPDTQLRNYVKGFIKKAEEAKQWREKGGTVDGDLIVQLKAIVAMLEEE